VLVARTAVVNGDEGLLARFASSWLGIKQITGEVLEAVAAALLEWIADPEGDVIGQIKTLYKRHRRGHRGIGETQLRGRRIDSLNREVVLPSGLVVELGQQVPASAAIDPSPGFGDPRILRLFAALTAIEREIVIARYSTADCGMTWVMAAEECGQPATVGESVRRKVKRLSQRIMAASSWVEGSWD